MSLSLPFGRKYAFYAKSERKIEPVLDDNVNGRAIERLEEIRASHINIIPPNFLENWSDVALYHPKGDVETAHAILLDPEEGAFDLHNALNHLTGKEWTKFTCSWFVFNALQSDLAEERAVAADSQLHPATFSPTMIESFIRFFTRHGERVFDPFAGIGSTLVAAKRSGRIGCGIELNRTYWEVCLKRTPEFASEIFLDSAENLAKLPIPNFEFSISSPPYWDVLNRSTKDFQTRRDNAGLHTKYSDDDMDLGNVENYPEFLARTVEVYQQVLQKLQPKRYLVIIVKNVKKEGKLYPLAWDLARELSQHCDLKDERIWIQDKIGLAPYGYPHSWASNILHHYCLVFQKRR